MRDTESSEVMLVVKNPPANAEDIRNMVWYQGWEDPLEVGMATHSSILAWKNPHGQRSLEGYNSWGRKKSDTTERLSTHEKMEMDDVIEGSAFSHILHP